MGHTCWWGGGERAWERTEGQLARGRAALAGMQAGRDGARGVGVGAPGADGVESGCRVPTGTGAWWCPAAAGKLLPFRACK